MELEPLRFPGLQLGLVINLKDFMASHEEWKKNLILKSDMAVGMATSKEPSTGI